MGILNKINEFIKFKEGIYVTRMACLLKLNI